jgi:putative CocE/NonD family hydrolase
MKNRIIRDYEGPEYGYATVCIDVRGTGSSFGSHPSFFPPDELKDVPEILDWIVKQPWSNGQVMTVGVSYVGMAAELAGVSQHPSLCGLVPIETMWDFYADVYLGGDGVGKNWDKIAVNLDRNDIRAIGLLYSLLLKGSAPVDSDFDGELMKQAILEHRDNERPHEYEQQIEFRDDLYGPTGITQDDFSVFSLMPEGPTSIPVYIWGSWFDSSTANTVIHHFLNWSVPFVGVIGSWAHNIMHDGSPYNSSKTKANPPRETMYKEFHRFFEFCRQGNVFQQKQILYYTIGEDTWRSTNIWPPEGYTPQKLYFCDNFKLDSKVPEVLSGSDEYDVDFTATTGTKSRWFTLVSQPVEYKNREKEGGKCLTYTTSPLPSDLELTGHPIANIYLSSTHEDGVLIVYLEDIDTKGDVHYLTEGGIRLIHRKLADNPFYESIGPQHSFIRSDSMPMIPGEVSEIKFSLLPISVVIKKDHRLRISVAGADKDNIRRCPEEGYPVLTIMRSKEYPSSIDLPLIQ